MNLSFSGEEKALFLEKRGFKIKRFVNEREEHVHGSCFRTVVYHKVVAVSTLSGESGEIEEIFNYELKKALLSL